MLSNNSAKKEIFIGDNNDNLDLKKLLKPLEINDRFLLGEKFQALDLQISEYNFNNIFLFRERQKNAILQDKNLFIYGVTYDGRSYLMPCDPIEKWDWLRLNELLQLCDCLCPIPQDWRHHFNSDEYHISFIDGDSDYVYTVEKLRDFPGRKLSAKRNLVKQFLRDWQVEVKELTADDANAVFYLLDIWLKQHPTEMGNNFDVDSCKEAIQNFNELGIEGRLYSVLGTPVGFIITNKLNSDTHSVHFLKADIQYKGIYQFIYQEFAEHLPKNCSYINLEQDMALPALRQAKHSYYPDMMLQKLRVSLKKER